MMNIALRPIRRAQIKRAPDYNNETNVKFIPNSKQRFCLKMVWT